MKIIELIACDVCVDGCGGVCVCVFFVGVSKSCSSRRPLEDEREKKSALILPAIKAGVFSLKRQKHKKYERMKKKQK